MNYEKIFPTLIGKSNLEFNSNLINIWKNIINHTEKVTIGNPNIDPNIKTEDYLTINERILDSLIFTSLKQQILNNAYLYAKECGIVFEDLQICNSWGYQIGLNNNPNNYHAHANSLISGVYYLTEGADIEFQRDNFPLSSTFKFNYTNSDKKDDFHFRITPHENLLILFPSGLSHKVTKNFTEERYCVAFNIIPKGTFGTTYGNFTL
jgi:uncharacterized protein (TIGR02466 family)